MSSSLFDAVKQATDALIDLTEAIQNTGHAMCRCSMIWCFPSAAAAGMRIVNKRGRNKLILIKRGDR